MAYLKPKPKLRAGQLDNIKTTLNRLFDRREIDFPYQNCLNCKGWSHENNKCDKFNAVPPPHILIYSCEAYEDDMEIPF